MNDRETPRFAYRIHHSEEQYDDNATALIEAVLRRAAEDSPIRVVLAGGSTPRPIYQKLAASDSIDWEHVQVFFGDERAVRPDDEASNYRMARESLLDAVDIPDENVYRMRGDIDPAEAACEYEQALQRVFDLDGLDPPRFDLILLGMGADGHTVSLFPGTRALEETERLVVANPVPKMETVRITLTYPVLNAAHQILFLVTGEDKAEAIQQVMHADSDVPPAGRISPDEGSVIWLLDEAAAARL